MTGPSRDAGKLFIQQCLYEHGSRIITAVSIESIKGPG